MHIDKESVSVVLLAIVCLIIGFLIRPGFGFDRAEELSNQRKIDSLILITQQDSLVKIQLEEKLHKSDSLFTVRIDSLRSKFNPHEKDKRINSVAVLSDSASLEYFSNWVSQIDSLAR